MITLHSLHRLSLYTLLLASLFFTFPQTRSLGQTEETQPNQSFSPWFTGPLLTSGGTTYTQGKIGLQYVYTSENNQQTHLLISSWGLGEKTDLQWTLPYTYKHASNATDSGMGDMTATLGYQLLSENEFGKKPAIKLTLGAIFPTGKSDNLSPENRKVSGFGNGAYRTKIGITAQKLFSLENGHFLRARWNLSETFSANSSINGISVYGGTMQTHGTMHLGNIFSTAVGMEYTLRPQWVAALDFAYSTTAPSQFSGTPGKLPPSLDQPRQASFSIAPALEYNITAATGIIMGINYGLLTHNTKRPSQILISFLTSF